MTESFTTREQAIEAAERIGLQVKTWPNFYRDYVLDYVVLNPSGVSVAEIVNDCNGDFVFQWETLRHG